MEKGKTPSTYLDWHYVQVPKKIVKSNANFCTFLYYYFSVGFLIKTLFSPWKRQVFARRSPGFDFREFFEVLSFNLISRVIGAIVRLTLILTWLISTLTTFIFGVIILLIWLVLPGFTLLPYLLLQEKKETAPVTIQKKTADPQRLLIRLAKTPSGQFVFSRLNLSPEEIINLRPKLEEKKKFEESLGKLLEEKKLVKEEITTKETFEIMSKKFTPFSKFLKNKRLKTKDVIAVVNWYLRQFKTLQKRGDFWQLKNLLKIPPLGKNLVFGYTPNLNRYCADLTHPRPYSHQLVGRKRETTQIEQILSRTAGNNVLLVGEPGVGRHTILEEFAKKVREGKVNPALSHKRVLDLGMRRLLSESKSERAAKGKIEEILNEAAYAGNVILVIDSFDQYVAVGSGRVDLTGVFTKAVAAGVQIVGITTFDNFAKYLYPNQEILKHFEKVEASPPTNEEALIILMDTASLYEKRNRVFVTYQALKEIIDKVDKYIVHIPFPEKAIDLLDETCVYGAQKKRVIITPQVVNRVISEKTKIPLGEIEEEEIEKLKNLEKVIHQRIIDQEEAVIAIARAMRRARVGITKGAKPIGSFLFMGPTGVGKTETAKALAEGYFGSENRMIRFDMSEYQGEGALDRVIGSLKTNEPGVFAKTIREKPFSLLLLDEIEKSHPNILNLFLVMIDEGYFTDAFGKKVDCRNLIIIGTSNAGTELIREKINEGLGEKELEREVVDYVQRKGIFSPEFINRFDAVVIYRPLTHENLLEIAKLMLGNLNKRLKKKDLSVKITGKLLEKMVKLGYDPAFGARPMNRVIQDKIEDQIAQKLLRGELRKGEEVEIEI